MTSETLTSQQYIDQRSESIGWHTIRAEMKKLTRRKGVMFFTLLGSVGIIVITFAILEAYHLADPIKYTYPGGVSGFNKIVIILSQVTIIPASILGTTAGSQDMESGVIRDLIVTGKSRTSIFLLRLVGASLVWIPPAVIAYLVGLGAVFGFGGTNPTPSLHLIVVGGIYCVGVSLVYVLTSTGLASLFGSRGPAIAVMIGWTFIIEAILLNVTALGPVREAFLTTAISGLSPVAGGARRLKGAGLSPSVLVDYITLIGWPVVLCVLGWFRSERLEA